MMKKLLIYSQAYPTSQNPHLAPFMESLAIALKEKFEVIVISPSPWIPFIKKTSSAKEERNGISILRPSYFSIPYITRWFNAEFMSIGSRKTFDDVVNNWKPDAVLSNFIYPDAVAGVKLSKTNSISAISVIRDTLTPQLKKWEYKIQWLNALGNSDAIICVSKSIQDSLASYGLENLNTVYNGVNADIFHIQDSKKARKELNHTNSELIVCAARHNKVKGLDTLIKSAAILIKKRPNIKVEIIGQESEYTAQLLRLVKKHNLTGIVNIRGAIPQTELAKWYNAADCVCLPTHNEGRPNSLIEAQACGTKIVSTNIPGMIESVHPKTLLVTPGNAEELAIAIDKTLSLKINKKEMSAWTKQFTWKKTAEQYKLIIDKHII